MSESSTTAEGLERRLNTRQLRMIAIGGAIGVGLFLGSTVTIGLAGPGVIVAYLFGALIAIVLAYALAEMAVTHPQAGSFGIYAERYLSPWSGFMARATYGFVQIVVIGAEVTAVGIYFAYWFPAVPAWIWVAASSLLLVTINSRAVNNFGEFEYWFALIKVFAIVVFILVGAALIFGVGERPAIGLANLRDAPGGFLPHGWTGVWLSLTLVITSYMGIEVVAVTAGEAEDPERSIPKAMRGVVFRLITFYVLAIAVIMAIRPAQGAVTGSHAIDGSPFVLAFDSAGIPYAASLMSAVVISAALSSANTNLYLSTRMLFSLSRSGYAPAAIGRVNARAVPLNALLLASLGMVLAVLLAVFSPGGAFLALFGTAVAGMLFVWLIILFTHLRFRRALSAQQLDALPVRLPLAGFAVPAAIVALLAIALTTFFVDGLRYTIPAMLPFVALMSVVYWRIRKRG